MIYTVTLNPTLDKTLSVPQLCPGEFHRAAILRAEMLPVAPRPTNATSNRMRA